MEPRVTAAGVRKKPSGSDVTPSFFLLVHAMKVTATCKTKKKKNTNSRFVLFSCPPICFSLSL